MFDLEGGDDDKRNRLEAAVDQLHGKWVLMRFVRVANLRVLMIDRQNKNRPMISLTTDNPGQCDKAIYGVVQVI